MLLSPASCHEQLTSLLSQDIGPHTALLATPHGQLVCCSSKERPDEQEGESTAEPWLDEPERIRLLLGLLSQWEQEESPRIECELGRLYVRSLPLPPAENTSANASMPQVRSQAADRFVLLVNGTSSTPWVELESKAKSFSL